jgi:hypothetical protein
MEVWNTGFVVIAYDVYRIFGRGRGMGMGLRVWKSEDRSQK